MAQFDPLEDSLPAKKKEKKTGGYKGGIRVNSAEIERRVAILYEKFATGLQRSDISQFAAAEWGMPQRTFEDYWRRVIKKAMETADRDRQDVWAQCMTVLGRAAQMAAEQRNPSAMQAAISTIAKLSCIDPAYQAVYEDSPRRR